MHSPFTVLHIPHSSKVIPAELRGSILLSAAELDQELIRMTDAYTDELFDLPIGVATSIVFPVSRLIVDPERFEDDTLEPMAACGMGVIYTETSRRLPLRTAPNDTRRNELLARYYRPHHARLTAAVNAALERWCNCLVIDCHSFPSVPLPYELDQSPARPDICLGTDAFHTPEHLAVTAEGLFTAAGFNVARNRPFAGALVPAAHYRRDPRVMAIMIEVNRRIYMDEGTGARLATFAETVATIQSAVAMLVVAATPGNNAEFVRM